MEQIERVAQLSILRALGFTGLAIGCVMVGLSYDPALSFDAGAVLTLLTAAVLVWKGLQAPTRNVKHTELWIMLDGKLGMPLERAQQVVGRVAQQLYYRYARYALGLALSFWAVGLGARLAV